MSIPSNEAGARFRSLKLAEYKLPMHVAAALATQRPELLRMAPFNLDSEAQREILRLLGDLIVERERFADKFALLKQTVDQTLDNIGGNTRKLERLFEAFEDGETRDELAEEIKRPVS